MEHTYAVIMAGGGGTRLWPVSRKKHPKHTLPLLGEETLFQSTVARLEGFITLDQVQIVTVEGQEEELKKQVPGIPSENYLIEPEPRGTASVIGLAASVLLKRDPQAVMLVLPSDHYIGNRGLFHRLMHTAVQVAHNGYLVTLGISPTFASTGYGYIQCGKHLPEEYDYPVYHVLRFTEKPDEEKARDMLASGDHSWNSGMFIWRADRILDEFERQMPELKATLEKINTTWDAPGEKSVLHAEWPRLKPVTVDYGILEHAENVAVLPADDLEWSDVGTWDSLFEVLLPDKDGNVIVNSEYMLLDTHDTLVFSTKKKLIITVGVQDLVVVDSGDALLVCHRNQAQQMRKVIENLQKMDKKEYL